MRGRLAAATLLLFASLASIQSASAIETWKVRSDLVNAFQFGTVSQAKKLIGGYTMVVKLGTINGDIAKIIPISTVAVLYFNTNGQVLAWSSKTDTVEAGTWKVWGHGSNDLCVFFPEGNGAGVCTMIFAYGAPFMESTKGNPFNLRAEKPAPYHLGRFGVSLKSIAKKLGV